MKARHTLHRHQVTNYISSSSNPNNCNISNNTNPLSKTICYPHPLHWQSTFIQDSLTTSTITTTNITTLKSCPGSTTLVGPQGPLTAVGS